VCAPFKKKKKKKTENGLKQRNRMRGDANSHKNIAYLPRRVSWRDAISSHKTTRPFCDTSFQSPVRERAEAHGVSNKQYKETSCQYKKLETNKPDEHASDVLRRNIFETSSVGRARIEFIATKSAILPSRLSRSVAILRK